MKPSEDLIREKLAQFEQPVRLSLSARYPPLASLLIFARISHRRLKKFFSSLGFRMVELKSTANSANSREKIKKGSLGFRMVEPKSTANGANSREKK